MKKLLLSILFSFISFTVLSQGCLPEGITFTTQEQIDNFQINYPESVRIEFYNQLRMLVDIIEQNQSAGKQQVVWNAKELPAGIYFMRLQAGNEVNTLKVIKL